jgi:hypothetical protein
MDLIASFQAPRVESQRIQIKNNQIEIGRENTADLTLDHPSISRKRKENPTSLSRIVEAPTVLTLMGSPLKNLQPSTVISK